MSLVNYRRRILLSERNEGPWGGLPGGGGGGRSFQNKFGGGVQHASQNPYPIYDQKSVIFPTLFGT